MVLFPIGKKEAFKKFEFLKICIGTQELDVFSVFEYFIDEVYISTGERNFKLCNKICKRLKSESISEPVICKWPMHDAIEVIYGKMIHSKYERRSTLTKSVLRIHEISSHLFLFQFVLLVFIVFSIPIFHLLG